jgi:sister-chromatid-cohesion protein PDS5
MTWRVSYASRSHKFGPLTRYAEGLFEKLLDPDEKVRAEVCKVYAQLDYETALHHVSTSQLKAIADRIRDRKVACS